MQREQGRGGQGGPAGREGTLTPCRHSPASSPDPFRVRVRDRIRDGVRVRGETED